MKNIKKTLIFVIAILISNSFAEANDLFELRKVEVTYRDFFPGGRNPIITSNGLANKQLGKELVLGMNIDILKLFYWNHLVHSTTDESKDSGTGQFRSVGWNFFAGVRLTNFLNFEYAHHSQHVLDTTMPFGFPLEDSFGIKLKIYSSGKDEDSVF